MAEAIELKNNPNSTRFSKNQPVDINNEVNFIYSSEKDIWIEDETGILLKMISEDRYHTIFRYEINYCECNCLYSRVKYLPLLYEGEFFNLMIWMRNIVKTKELKDKQYDNIVIAKVQNTILLMGQEKKVLNYDSKKALMEFLERKSKYYSSCNLTESEIESST